MRYYFSDGLMFLDLLNLIGDKFVGHETGEDIHEGTCKRAFYFVI